MEKNEDLNNTSSILKFVSEIKDIDYDEASIETYRQKSEPIIEKIRRQIQADPTLANEEPRESNKPDYTIEWIFGGIMVVSLLVIAIVFKFFWRKE